MFKHTLPFVLVAGLLIVYRFCVLLFCGKLTGFAFLHTLPGESVFILCIGLTGWGLFDPVPGLFACLLACGEILVNCRKIPKTMVKKKKKKNDLGLSGTTYICDAGVKAGWNIAGDPSLQVARDITIEVVNGTG